MEALVSFQSSSQNAHIALFESFFFFFSPTLLASGLKEQTKDLDTVVHALQILMSFLNNCHEYVSCMDGLCLYLCVVLNAFYGKH